eukprot:GFUD01023455.1.p1 GENE.GFUD01023455.1~~GFUD01023455.1.p1  ORF type:complete len:183 (+),score=58.91 GFUD01023455.1:343-891(+)
MSAPPMEHAQYQQAMPAVPPSYDAAMSGQGYPPAPGQGYPPAPGQGYPPPAPAGYPGQGYPPGQGPPGQMYPPLPEKAGGPGGPPPPQAMQPPVQVVTQVQYVSGPSFGHRPVTMVCPHCQKNITTRTSSEPGALAWIIGGVLCFVGLWPCACIPCCIDSLNQVTHTCPGCSNTLGRYKGSI